MQQHQSKKRPLLRALKAWTASMAAFEPSPGPVELAPEPAGRPG
jgi:hypothetical protein